MFSFLLKFFQKEHIDCFSVLPLEECKVQKPYLLEREGIERGSVILLAIPYYTRACNCKDRNLSAYAVPRDYHLYFKELYARIIPTLEKAFPGKQRKV